MSAMMSRRFNAQCFDITVTGLVDMATAVLLVEHLEVARSYYRYAKLCVDVTHATFQRRAASHVGVALRAAEMDGAEVMLRASERTRSRLMTASTDLPTRPRERRIGFQS